MTEENVTNEEKTDDAKKREEVLNLMGQEPRAFSQRIHLLQILSLLPAVYKDDKEVLWRFNLMCSDLRAAFKEGLQAVDKMEQTAIEFRDKFEEKKA